MSLTQTHLNHNSLPKAMKEEIILFTSFSAFVTGLICAGILLTFKKRQSFHNTLLAFGLIGISIISLANTFTYTDFYLRFPHFSRIAFPIHYAVPPLLYIYVRSTLRRESKFRPFDWILFVPALLHLIELLPFYFQTTEEKRVIMQQFLQDPKNFTMHREGVLPPFFHPALKSGLGLVYAIAALIALKQFRRNSAEGISNNKKVWFWLLLLQIQLGAYFIAMLVGIALHNYVGDLSSYYTISLMVLLFFISLILFFRPEILYGLPPVYSQEQKNGVNITAAAKFVFTQEARIDYKARVETLLDRKKPFLKKRYSIGQMSEDTDIPTHQLSALINMEYDTNFNVLINTRRIEHIIAGYRPGDLQRLTLEGIAENAGFNSRYTFIKAFKRIKGVTPSEFFKAV